MSDPNSKFDKTFTIDVEKIEPQVSWGTNPAMVSDVTGKVLLLKILVKIMKYKLKVQKKEGFILHGFGT